MKTFALHDGDLVLDSGSYTEVTGHEKLTQDLGNALREFVGVDRFHRRWGSQLPAFIGQPADEWVAQRITEEATRVIGNAMAVQRDLMARDASRGRPPRFGSSEVIEKIKSIQVQQEYSTFHVRIVLTTLTAGEVVLITTVRG